MYAAHWLTYFNSSLLKAKLYAIALQVRNKSKTPIIGLSSVFRCFASKIQFLIQKTDNYQYVVDKFTTLLNL